MRNPYAVLGIPTSADARTIRRAYKKLAVEFHPDRNAAPEAIERFKEVSEAYAVLTNERERQRYARRRRQEHADRAEYRKAQAAAAQRRSTARRSETAEAAERVFWEYARQVQARRQQPRPGPANAKRPTAGHGWADRAAPIGAAVLIAIYAWRSAAGRPLQPWLPAGTFPSHSPFSPIWITIGLGLLMIVCPRWCRIPLVMDEVKEVRLVGWGMVLLAPLLSAGVLWLTQLAR